MKPSDTMTPTNRLEIVRIVTANNCRNPRVFGSVLHGTDTEGSDLDILVDPLPDATLFDIGAIRHELLLLLGVPVDVLTPRALPDELRSEIEATAQPILQVKPSATLTPENRVEIVRIVTARKCCNTRVFGSVLHGTDTPESDLDLLVDALPGTTLFDLGGLQVDLEDLLKVRVEVITPGDLPEKWRDEVIATAKPI